MSFSAAVLDRVASPRNEGPLPDATGYPAVPVDANVSVRTTTHDAANRLTTLGAHHTYTYAPDGLRRSAHFGSTANPVSFVWDGDDLLNDYVLGGVSCRYDVVDGEVFGEKRGANRYLYLPDPLGSVVNLLDSSQNIAGTYTYWPYGEVLSHTGVNTPLQFVGALGYYTGTANRVYVRARYYRPDLGRWQTQDPIGWPPSSSGRFFYAGDAPVSAADPSGLQAKLTFGRGCTDLDKQRIRADLEAICRRNYGAVEDCMTRHCPNPRSSCFANMCDGSRPLHFECHPVGDPKCKRGDCGWVIPPNLGTIHVCGGAVIRNPDCKPFACVLAHELIHSCGVQHFGTPDYYRGRCENVVEDCQCFNCVADLGPGCDGFYAHRGRRYRRADCESIPL